MISRLRKAEVIQVIHTRTWVNDDHGKREVDEYWSLDGERLGHADPNECNICRVMNCTSDHK